MKVVRPVDPTETISQVERGTFVSVRAAHHDDVTFRTIGSTVESFDRSPLDAGSDRVDVPPWESMARNHETTRRFS